MLKRSSILLFPVVVIMFLVLIGSIGVPDQAETPVLLWLFILLLLGGIGFPIPEELPLFLGGIAVAQNVEPFELLFIVCYVGVLIGDQTMYLLGYFFGQKILHFSTKSPYLPAITEERVNEVREGLRKRRLVYLFIGRHLFILRSVTFVVAGSLRVPYVEFFIADALAALLSVTLFMGLGYVVGDQIDAEVIAHLSHQANAIILAIVVFTAIALLAWRKRQAKSQRSVSEITSEREDQSEPRHNSALQ